jgi:hypothetical protein
MKNAILFFLILCANLCTTQAQTYTPIHNYGQSHERIKVGYNFKVPSSATFTRYTNDLLTPGDLQLYMNVDTFLMYHSGSKWVRMIDSAYLASHLIASSVNVSNASTLTLSTAYTDHVFSGTTTTWRLPPVSGNTNIKFFLRNRGSGNITLISSAGANDIYFTVGSTNTITISAGTGYILVNDGTYWLVE